MHETALKNGAANPTDFERIKKAVERLPFRAQVVFASRCARRVKPLARLWGLLGDAYSAGLRVAPPPGKAWCAIESLATVGFAAMNAIDDFQGTSLDAASDACEFAVNALDEASKPAIHAAALSDLKSLQRMKLGKKGTDGKPITWFDPRLGPLWPEGIPEWNSSASNKWDWIEEC